MKKTINKFLVYSFLVTVLCFTSKNSFSQINFSNPDFESWSSSSLPTNWNSLSYSGYSLCDISRTNNAASGNYAVELQASRLSQTLTTMFNLPQIVIPGIITNATVNLTSLSNIRESLSGLAGLFSDPENIDMESLNVFSNILSNGLNINQVRFIDKVKGKYTFTPVSENDIAIFAVLCLKTSSNGRNVVGGGFKTITEQTNSYIDFSVDVTQYSEADELIFAAIIGTKDVSATNFGKLRVDNLSIEEGSELGIEETMTNDFVVYPNPSSDNTFKIKCNNSETISVFNTLGVKVLEVNNYISETPLRVDEKGVYLIKIGDKFNKLVIK